MDKKIALKIILESSKRYRTNLENQNLLFVFGNINNPKYTETTFLKRNFLHLTGCETNLHANEFYDKAIKTKLTEHDFELRLDGTTELKLSVLFEMMNIEKSARMIGNYNSIKWELKTDKIVGNVRACIGFTKSENDKYYVPNTLLKEDIRGLTDHHQERILVVFKKNKFDTQYKTICYSAKKIEYKNIKFSDNIKNKLDPNLLKN